MAKYQAQPSKTQHLKVKPKLTELSNDPGGRTDFTEHLALFKPIFLSHTSWSQLLKIKMRNEIMLNVIYGCHHWREAAESKKLKRLKVAFFKFIQIAQQST